MKDANKLVVTKSNMGAAKISLPVCTMTKCHCFVIVVPNHLKSKADIKSFAKH